MKAWDVKKTDKGQILQPAQEAERLQAAAPQPVQLLAAARTCSSAISCSTAKVLSTHPDYGHRDVCLFFGYQDPAHFYYVHLGKQTDDHANQIFIVNDKPRDEDLDQDHDGTNWDEKWHHVKMVRRVADGTIEVYFDDMKTPVMTAKRQDVRLGAGGHRLVRRHQRLGRCRAVAALKWRSRSRPCRLRKLFRLFQV